ncbi:protein translocase subunit SecD [Devosia sp. XJ19-1]|uniref:Multifunctional fusion protein n=1 Tax=Devosia ureilytica TaxID=2952754 RepID=A0A9Q4ALU7_9HYPH|nr:protein translocase subunit SecD [Devosia ureilytica]MCP8882138.1 protein translocase subunit SecD [Devosia ureilytica]MCP8885976.1 protein translocase subunit SecD [Devosia ureilytica]
MQSSPIRTVVILFAAVIGLLFAVPNFLSKDVVDALPGWLPKQSMVLGLDLQGGSHLLLEVNRDSIVTERLSDLRRDARNVLANENGIGNIITTDVASNTITIELTDPTQKDAAQTAVEGLQNTLSNALFAGTGTNELSFGETADGKLTIGLTPDGISQRMSALVAQSVEVIRSRIDELGTTEPTIQRQGDTRLLVQVPGFGDSERLKNIISQTARLTFHMVYPGLTPDQAEAQGLPPGTMILPSQDGTRELLYEDIAIGGESLSDAQPSFDQQRGIPVVTFRFDTRGAITFGEITSQSVGQRFAIVLDNTVITAPVIQQPITGGSGQISGSFTTASANDLAVLLRAGALPASLDVVEERSVGPSLGADSVRGGVIAGIIGGVSTVLFMLIAYGTFGAFANLALILNIGLVIGALSALGATLTLPGIAGIVLTMGMAVDANVLIFERMREEQAAGRGAVQSIQAGFQNAMSAILDSNVTTFIAAVVLFFLGSGPVQGFAVTLAIGILTTLFTAYFITMLIIGRWYTWRRPKKLKIQLLRLIPDDTTVPFMSWRRIAIIASMVLTLGSVGLFFIHGMNLGIDFKGGTSVEVQHQDGPADVGHIRELLSALDLGDVQVQGFGTPEDVLIRIELQDGGPEAQQAAVDSVVTTLATENYELRRTEAVSGTVSSELALSSTIGLSVAVLGILIYLWFRFEWQFAVGAVVSTLHDVVLTLGFFSLTGIEFNQSSIAAILTIVGYSLNDTVVVYDRVREFQRKYRKIPLVDLLDRAINSTLSRTVLTGPTTLFALLALAVFGGEVIQSFVLSMIFGVLIGTYSSIFIAAPILVNLGLKDRPEPETEAKEKSVDGAAV